MDKNNTIKKINELGKNYSKVESFEFLEFIENNGTIQSVKIINKNRPKGYDIAVVSIQEILKNQNPFLIPYERKAEKHTTYTEKDLVYIQLIGKSFPDHMSFSILEEKNTDRNDKITIQHNLSKEKRVVFYSSILKRENPFLKMFISKSFVLKKMKNLGLELIKIEGDNFKGSNDEIWRMNQNLKINYKENSIEKTILWQSVESFLEGQKFSASEQSQIDRINKIGLSFEHEYEKFQFVSFAPEKSKMKMMKLQNLKTGEIATVQMEATLFRNSNPFKLGKFSVCFANKIIEEMCNDPKYDLPFEKFEYVNHYHDSKKKIRVEIRELYSGEVKDYLWLSIYKKKENPFSKEWFLPEKYLIEKVNELGSKQEIIFEFVEIVQSYKNLKNSNFKREFKLKQPSTGLVAKTTYERLITKGIIPKFITELNLDEFEHVHPLIESFLKERKLNYFHEKKISKDSRIDFLCFIEDFVFGIEAKSDRHSETILTNSLEQAERYSKELSKKYKQKFLKVFLTSPEGNGGTKWSIVKAEIEDLIKKYQKS